jgi:methionine-gamma-lyase
MERSSENARKVAELLERHPKVEWVRYPGLPSHPQYEIGKKQSNGDGAMISFELKGGLEAGITMMNHVHLCTLAVSLGGVESLIQHPASMTHAGMGKEQREQANITDGLVRLSIGIEHIDDILTDIEHALDHC